MLLSTLPSAQEREGTLVPLPSSPTQSLCHRSPPSREMAEGCVLNTQGQGVPCSGSWQRTGRGNDGGEASRDQEVEA